MRRLDGVDKGYGGFDGKGAVPPAPVRRVVKDAILGMFSLIEPKRKKKKRRRKEPRID